MKIKKFVLGVAAIATLSQCHSIGELKKKILRTKAVSIESVVLDRETSRDTFKKDLHAVGVVPLKVELHNRSLVESHIALADGAMSVIEARGVAKRSFNSTLLRNFFFKVGALAAWPLTIPSSIDSIYTAMTHKAFKARVAAAIFSSQERLKAGERATKYIFLRSAELPEEITFEITDISSGKVSYKTVPLYS